MHRNSGGTMGVITIHALDPVVEKRIRGKARRDRKSLNQTVKELLADSIAAAPALPGERRDEFVEFAGIWTAGDEREFASATADFERVDMRDWQ
jgi:hypothetical protein